MNFNHKVIRRTSTKFVLLSSKNSTAKIVSLQMKENELFVWTWTRFQNVIIVFEFHQFQIGVTVLDSIVEK